MKLSKALKLKNKKVSEYNTIVTKMVSYNSYDIDSKKVYNSKELYNEVVTKLLDLVKFKAAIHTTTEPIRERIFELAELKNLLMNVNRLNTTEGKVKSRGYDGSDVSVYACDIVEEEKVQIMQALQNSIETIQDEIDAFNATTDLKGY